jgi:hypothetical protein
MTTVVRGETRQIIKASTTGAGLEKKYFTIQGDGLAISVWVTSITGTLDIRVYTEGDEGQRKLIHTVSTISAPTPELLIEKIGCPMSTLYLEAEYSGAVEYTVAVRSINSLDAIIQEPLDVNLQIGDVDVDPDNPVPISETGAYHTPLVETITLVANTENSLSLRSDVGLIIGVSDARAPFQTGYVAAGAKIRTPAGSPFIREKIRRGNGPPTLYFESKVAATITVETWLIGS